MRRTRKRVIAGAAVVVAVGVGVAAMPSVRHEYRLWRSCLASEGIEARVGDARLASIEGGKPLVGVIGDSWAQGAELPDPLDAFPYDVGLMTGMDVLVDGKQGTGFLNAGPCQDDPIKPRLATMLETRPDVLVIALGLNDAVLNDDDVHTAVDDAFSTIDEDRPHRVIVVAPFDPPTAPHARVRDVGAYLEEASLRFDFEYVSVNDAPLTFLEDGIHPDEAGRQMVASEVADVIGRPK